MHEVFATLFNDRAIAYRVHQGFEHARSRSRPACSAWCAATSAAAGVMFTLDTEIGLPRRRVHHRGYGLGETVVQGAVNPDEFYVYKPALEAGQARASSAATWAPSRSRWIYAEAAAGGPPVRTVDVRAAEQRNASRSSDADVDRARPPGADHREALRPADGHRVGQGRRRRQALHPAGAAGDRAEPRRPGQREQRYRLKGTRHGARRGPRDRPADRRGPGARDREPRPRWTRCRPATCWSPT